MNGRLGDVAVASTICAHSRRPASSSPSGGRTVSRERRRLPVPVVVRHGAAFPQRSGNLARVRVGFRSFGRLPPFALNEPFISGPLRWRQNPPGLDRLARDLGAPSSRASRVGEGHAFFGCSRCESVTPVATQPHRLSGFSMLDRRDQPDRFPLTDPLALPPWSVQPAIAPVKPPDGEMVSDTEHP